jgi:hypothetical protein
MDRTRAELSLSRPVSRSDSQAADGFGAACMEHSIEDRYPDSRFGLLAAEASCSQTRTDDGLVSAHRDFNESSLSIVNPIRATTPTGSDSPILQSSCPHDGANHE